MGKTNVTKIPEWEVLEDNAGGLYLVIFHKTSRRPRKILENWEFGEVGHMADALYSLEDDPDAWTIWATWTGTVSLGLLTVCTPICTKTVNV